MTKKIGLYGIGNGIMDLLLKVSEQDFAKLGFEKKSYRLLEEAEQLMILDKIKGYQPTLASGGSVANSVIGYAQLGGKAAFSCCLADDQYGHFYKNEMMRFGIDINTKLVPNESTGTCLVAVTPDGERTMSTCLAVSAKLSQDLINPEMIKNAEYVYLEGYLLANPANGQPVVKHSLDLCKQFGTKVAFTISDKFIVDIFRSALDPVLSQVDLFFANEDEAKAVTGQNDRAQSYNALKKLGKDFVMTAGADGAYIYMSGKDYHCPAFECAPLDLTGAGDMFSGAFIYGITHGQSVENSARGACFLAMKVISQIGARLHEGADKYWQEVV